MYALLVTLGIDAARSDDAMDLLHRFVVPTVKQGPGFISGTWMRSADGTVGHNVILYDSEQDAHDAAARAAQGPPAGAPTTFVSAEVFEVVAQA